jgi:hypothetical protein
MVKKTMLEISAGARDEENERYRHPDPPALRKAMREYLDSLPPEFHHQYHIPSLEEVKGEFQASTHRQPCSQLNV